MINRIYQCTNKSGRKILIVAGNEEQAIDISCVIGFVKERYNVKVKDLTDSYVTSSRQGQGLDIDKLNPGQLLSVSRVGKVYWTTYLR